MWILFFLPFLIQSAAILFDEFYFHHRRGLPKWERIGHPVDTLSLILCFLLILYVPYSSAMLKVYMGLAAFSCLMVTKDEFIHKHYSPAEENWLHALLFILHPITLLGAAFLWPISQGLIDQAWFTLGLGQEEALYFLRAYTFSIFSFFIYQIVFWNFIWKAKPNQNL